MRKTRGLGQPAAGEGGVVLVTVGTRIPKPGTVNIASSMGVGWDARLKITRRVPDWMRAITCHCCHDALHRG
jgi:hypothetical protein